MLPLLLINPNTKHIAAELYLDENQEKVVIKEQWILNYVQASGIVVSGEFKKKYNCRLIIYPTDEPRIFAKAFQEITFTHGLQQKGYFWRRKNEDDNLSNEELANKIIEIHRKFLI